MRRKFDVGIVVPLREEFRYVVEVATQLDSLSHDGTYFYRLDFGAISVVCCLVDQIGPLPALQATTRLLAFADVKLIVLLGLGGALEEDVAVGDVVIATEINEFQANSKAEPAGQSYEVRYSGRHWPLEFRIREAASHFEFSGGAAFTRWQADASSDYVEIDVPGKEDICSSRPSLHLGPIASGSTVAASSAFVAEVKRINRKFLAIDMEAAGVAPAAAERIHPVACLVVRGISDDANEQKKTLDHHGEGAWRRYAVRNATRLLRALLTWDGFLRATALGPSEGFSDGGHLASQLAMRLKSCVGGRWVIGVTFGVYGYGPRVVNGEKVVPMDLSRLRVLDPRVASLLDEADKQKSQLLARGQIQEAVEGFGHLMEAFRNRLGSADANALLKDFDRVVSEILCPEDHDEQVETWLLEADRLEEEVGIEAVIEFLKGGPIREPQIRARYVEALANANRWNEVSVVVAAIDCTEMSRSELEHGSYACAKVELFPRAAEMLRQHQNDYDDNAAKLFRRELIRQHPQISEQGSGKKT